MEDAEKMAALKRAYAEIILNTAKESAARILLSERRAVQSQQSLVAAKEEALATLLRLKSIMDAKIKEAEKTSLGQCRRIQELEVQLSDAKDTICCLRTELKRVNSELEKIKINLTEPFTEQNTSNHAIMSKDRSEDSKHNFDFASSSPIGLGHESNSDIEHTTQSQRTAIGDCCFVDDGMEAETQKELYLENECTSNPDLASIIMRSKEPDLYRNGCTQRIRALERKTPNGRLPPVKTEDNCSNCKNELVVCNRKTEHPCTKISVGADKIGSQTETNPESKVMVQPASSYENGQIKFFRRFSSKRMGKCKNMAPLNSGNPDHVIVDNEPSEISCSKVSEQDNMTESGGALSKVVNGEPQGTNSLSAGNFVIPTSKKLHMAMSFRNEVSGFLQTNKRTTTRAIAIRKIHPDPDSQISSNPVSGTGDVECQKSLIDSSKETVLTGGVQNDTGETLQVDDSTLFTPNQKVKHGRDDAPMKSDPIDEKICEPNEASTQGGGDRFLRYTFCRKRKRGSSDSCDEVPPSENNASKKKMADKQNALPEPQKPSLVKESSRERRRMAQVARQLISLSGKRWW